MIYGKTHLLSKVSSELFGAVSTTKCHLLFYWREGRNTADITKTWKLTPKQPNWINNITERNKDTLHHRVVNLHRSAGAVNTGTEFSK